MIDIFRKAVSFFKRDSDMIKKLVFTASSRGLSAGGTFLFNFVLAKKLDIDSFGYFMLAYSILIGLSFFAKAGMPLAILRFVGILFSDGQVNTINYLKKKTYLISFILSLILGLLLILSAQFISDSFFDGMDASNMIKLFALSLPFYSFLNIQSAYLKAIKKPELAPFFEVGLTVFLTSFLIWGISIFGTTINIEIATIIFMISTVIVALCGYITLQRILKGVSQEDIVDKVFSPFNIKVFYRTLPDYSLSTITNYFLKFSPTLILAIYVTGFQIGLYSLANSISFIISFVLWIISSVYAPYFASAHKNKDTIKLRSLVIRSMIYCVFIALPIFIIILFFPELILSYFGEEFVQAKWALLILSFAQMFNVLTGPIYFLLNMTGYEAYLRKIILFTALISISASFLLIPMYGYMGAVYANAIGLVLQNSFAFYHSNKYLKLKLL